MARSWFYMTALSVIMALNGFIYLRFLNRINCTQRIQTRPRMGLKNG